MEITTTRDGGEEYEFEVNIVPIGIIQFKQINDKSLIDTTSKIIIGIGLTEIKVK